MKFWSDVLGRVYERWDRISGMAKPNAHVRWMIVNDYLSWHRRLARTAPRPGIEPPPDFRIPVAFVTKET
jgi:hypothetical protein